MTRQIFNEVLESNDIAWNDLVRITIINPYAKWWKIFTPQTLVFDGALDYTLNSYHVGLCVKDDREKFGSKWLHFEFDQIIGIKKIKDI